MKSRYRQKKLVYGFIQRLITIVIVFSFLSHDVALAQGNTGSQCIAPSSIFEHFDQYFKTNSINIPPAAKLEMFHVFTGLSRSIYSLGQKKQGELFTSDRLKQETEKRVHSLSRYLTIIPGTIKIHSESGNKFFAVNINIILSDGTQTEKTVLFYNHERPPLKYLKGLITEWDQDDEQYARERGFWIIDIGDKKEDAKKIPEHTAQAQKGDSNESNALRMYHRISLMFKYINYHVPRLTYILWNKYLSVLLPGLFQAVVMFFKMAFMPSFRREYIAKVIRGMLIKSLHDREISIKEVKGLIDNKSNRAVNSFIFLITLIIMNEFVTAPLAAGFVLALPIPLFIKGPLVLISGGSVRALGILLAKGIYKDLKIVPAIFVTLPKWLGIPWSLTHLMKSYNYNFSQAIEASRLDDFKILIDDIFKTHKPREWKKPQVMAQIVRKLSEYGSTAKCKKMLKKLIEDEPGRRGKTMLYERLIEVLEERSVSMVIDFGHEKITVVLLDDNYKQRGNAIKRQVRKTYTIKDIEQARTTVMEELRKAIKDAIQISGNEGMIIDDIIVIMEDLSDHKTGSISYSSRFKAVEMVGFREIVDDFIKESGMQERRIYFVDDGYAAVSGEKKFGLDHCKTLFYLGLNTSLRAARIGMKGDIISQTEFGYLYKAEIGGKNVNLNDVAGCRKIVDTALQLGDMPENKEDYNDFENKYCRRGSTELSDIRKAFEDNHPFAIKVYKAVAHAIGSAITAAIMDGSIKDTDTIVLGGDLFRYGLVNEELKARFLGDIRGVVSKKFSRKAKRILISKMNNNRELAGAKYYAKTKIEKEADVELLEQLSMQAALKELDAFLNQEKELPSPEFVGFEGWKKRPAREFIQEHISEILWLVQNEGVVVHKQSDGRLRFTKLVEHFSMRSGSEPPLTPAVVQGERQGVVEKTHVFNPLEVDDFDDDIKRYRKEAALNMVTILQALGIQMDAEDLVLNLGSGEHPVETTGFNIMNIDSGYVPYDLRKSAAHRFFKGDFFDKDFRAKLNAVFPAHAGKKIKAAILYNMWTYLEIYAEKDIRDQSVWYAYLRECFANILNNILDEEGYFIFYYHNPPEPCLDTNPAINKVWEIMLNSFSGQLSEAHAFKTKDGKLVALAFRKKPCSTYAVEHGDGFIQSRDGMAAAELNKIRTEQRERLKLAEIKDFDKIAEFIERSIKEFEESLKTEENQWRKEALEKQLPRVKEGFELLKKLHQEGRIYSFNAIVYHTEDYALAYGNDEEIGISEELLDLPMELMAELLLHEAICFKINHHQAKDIQRELFKQNYDGWQSKLRLILREIIDKKARIVNGPDPLEVVKNILGETPQNMELLYIDRGNYGRFDDTWKHQIRDMVEGEKSYIFTGDLEFIVHLVNSFSFIKPYELKISMEQFEGIYKVLVDREDGIVGVHGVPEELNEKIKQMLPEGEQRKFVNIIPFFILIELYKDGCACAQLKEMIRDCVLGKGLNINYDTFIAFIEYIKGLKDKEGAIQKEIYELKQKRREDEDKAEDEDEEEDFREMSEEEALLENKKHEVYVWREKRKLLMASLLTMIKKDELRLLVRRYVLASEQINFDLVHSLSEIVKEITDSGDDKKLLKELAWEMYLDSDNTSEENEKLRKYLLIVIDETHRGIGWIFSEISEILRKGELNKCYKAIDIFLRLKIRKDDIDHLSYVVFCSPYKKEILAAYWLMYMTLIGPEERMIDRWGRMSHNTPVSDLLKPELRNVYYYLLKLHETRNAEGALNYSADRRIIRYTIALDNDSSFPGEHGFNWFTHLRSTVHTYASSGDLKTVRALLSYWKNKVFMHRSQWGGLINSIPNDFSGDTLDKYSGLLNKLLCALHEKGMLRSLEGDDFLDEFNSISEEDVISALKQAGTEEDEYYTERLEYAIRLFYAMIEKYDVLSAAIIPKIKGEAGEDRMGEREFEKEKMIERTEFMRKEYDQLIEVIDSNDAQLVLSRVSRCCLYLKEYLLSGKVMRTEFQDEDQIKEELLNLDYNLYLFGKERVIKLLDQITQSRSMEDLKAHIDSLAAIGRFLIAEGLGGVEFSQLVYELENGSLTYSQLHDLVRALRTEVHKITRKINEDMRAGSAHILDNVDFYELTEEWQKNAKTDKVVDKWGNPSPFLTDEGKQEIIGTVIDTMVRDTQILSFDSALGRFSEILETGLIQINDRMAVERQEGQATEVKDDLSPHFFRFGQPEVIPRPELLSLWSKKGLNLVKMTKEGINVPPGVIASSGLVTRPDVFHSDEFRREVEKEIALIQKYSKYPDLKLLLYARSGSAFTLPGLLTTIPNLGMNDEEAADLAEKTGDVWFAYDTYAEFIRSYAINILGIPEEYFQDILNVYEKDKLTGEEMKEVVEKYKRVVVERGVKSGFSTGSNDIFFERSREGGGGGSVQDGISLTAEFHKIIPKNMIEQVMKAIDSVYASWDSEDARAYRERHKISQEWGTVVILQKGVFGNLDITQDGRISGTGFGALRILPDGREAVQGKFRFRAHGDQLMSRADQNYVLLSNSQKIGNEQTLEELQPEVYQELLKNAHKLKDIFGNNQQFEFVVELNKLWITQSNDDFVTDEYPEFVDVVEREEIGRGHGVSAGAFRGWIANSLEKANELLEKYNREKPEGVDGVILLVNRVNPEFINRIPKGVAICAKVISVHAETLAQKNGIPSLYGVSGMEFNEAENCWYINGRKMPDGETISIDGHENQLVYHNSGRIFEGSVPLAGKKDGKTEVERRTPRAIDRIRELREAELYEEALANTRISLTRFEKEILEVFKKYLKSQIDRQTIDRYRNNYMIIMDKIALFCRDLDFKLYGDEFKAILTKRLGELGIEFNLFMELNNIYSPKGKDTPVIIGKVIERLSFVPPENPLPDEIDVYDINGNPVKITFSDIANRAFDIDGGVAILHPLKKPVKLVSFDLDEAINGIMQNEGFDKLLELFRRIKTMGIKIAITSTNPSVLDWFHTVKQSNTELNDLVDYCEYTGMSINLEQYVKRLGISRDEVIHFGSWTRGSSYQADLSSLHEDGFVTVAVRDTYNVIKDREVLRKEIDAVFFGWHTTDSIMKIIESYKWGKGQDGSGALKEAGPPLSEEVIEEAEGKEKGWREKAKEVEPKESTKFKIKAKLLKVDDLPEGVIAWHLTPPRARRFMDESEDSEKADDGLIIVVRDDPEKIPYLDELIFHEYTENKLMEEKHMRRREAHIAANVKQIINFAPKSRLTPFHQAQLEKMSDVRLFEIIQEYYTSRTRHFDYHMNERKDETKKIIKNYEKLFVETAERIWQERIKRSIPRSSEEVFKLSHKESEDELNLAKMVDFIGLKPGDRVLDIYPQNRVNVALASSVKGADVDVLNISDRENYAEEGGYRMALLRKISSIIWGLKTCIPMPRYFSGDMYEAKFELKGYNAIFLLDVLDSPILTHVERERMLLRVFELLADEGHLLISFKHPEVVEYLSNDNMRSITEFAGKYGYKLKAERIDDNYVDFVLEERPERVPIVEEQAVDVAQTAKIGDFETKSTKLLSQITEKSPVIKKLKEMGISIKLGETRQDELAVISADRKNILIDPDFAAEIASNNVTIDDAVFLLNAYCRMFYVQAFFNWGDEEWSGTGNAAFAGCFSAMITLSENPGHFFRVAESIHKKHGVIKAIVYILRKYSGRNMRYDAGERAIDDDIFTDFRDSLRENSNYAKTLLAKEGNYDSLHWGDVCGLCGLAGTYYNEKEPEKILIQRMHVQKQDGWPGEGIRQTHILAKYCKQRLTAGIVLELLKLTQDNNEHVRSEARLILSNLFYSMKDAKLGKKLLSDEFGRQLLTMFEKGKGDLELYKYFIKFRPEAITRKDLDLLWRKVGHVRILKRGSEDDKVAFEGEPKDGQLLSEFFASIPKFDKDNTYTEYPYARTILGEVMQNLINLRFDLFTEKDFEQLLFVIGTSRRGRMDTKEDDVLKLFNIFCKKRQDFITSDLVDSLIDKMITKHRDDETKREYLDISRETANVLRILMKARPKAVKKEHFTRLLRMLNMEFRYVGEGGSDELIGDVICDIIDSKVIKINEELINVLFEKNEIQYSYRRDKVAVKVFKKMLDYVRKPLIKKIARKLLRTIVYKVTKTEAVALSEDAVSNDIYDGLVMSAAIQYLDIAKEHVDNIYNKNIVSQLFCAYCKLMRSRNREKVNTRHTILSLMERAFNYSHSFITRDMAKVFIRQIKPNKKDSWMDDSGTCFSIYTLYADVNAKGITISDIRRILKFVLSEKGTDMSYRQRDFMELLKRMIKIYASYSDDHRGRIIKWVFKVMCPLIEAKADKHSDMLEIMSEVLRDVCKKGDTPPKPLISLLKIIIERKDNPDSKDQTKSYYSGIYYSMILKGFIPFTHDILDVIINDLFSGNNNVINFQEIEDMKGFDFAYVRQKLEERMFDVTKDCPVGVFSAYVGFIHRKRIIPTVDDLLKYITLYMHDRRPLPEYERHMTRFGKLIEVVWKLYPEYRINPDVTKGLREIFKMKDKALLYVNLHLLQQFMSLEHGFGFFGGSRAAQKQFGTENLVDVDIIRNLINTVMADETEQGNGMESGTYFGNRRVSDEGGVAYECLHKIVEHGCDPRAFPRDIFASLIKDLNKPERRDKAILVLYLIIEQGADFINEELFMKLIQIIEDNCSNDRREYDIRTEQLFLKLIDFNENALSSKVEAKLIILMQGGNSALREFALKAYLAMVKNGQTAFLGAKVKGLLYSLKTRRDVSNMFYRILSCAIKNDTSVLDEDLFNVVVNNIQSDFYDHDEEANPIRKVYEEAIRQDFAWFKEKYTESILERFMSDLEKEEGDTDLESRFRDYQEYHSRARDRRTGTLWALRLLIENKKEYISQKNADIIKTTVLRLLKGGNEMLLSSVLEVIKKLIMAYPDIIDADLEKVVSEKIMTSGAHIVNNAVDAYKVIYVKRPDICRPSSLERIANVLYYKKVDGDVGDYSLRGRVEAFFRFARICPAVLNSIAFKNLLNIIQHEKSHRFLGGDMVPYLIFNELTIFLKKGMIKDIPEEFIYEAVRFIADGTSYEFFDEICRIHPDLVAEKLVNYAFKKFMGDTAFAMEGIFMSDVSILTAILKSAPLKTKYAVLYKMEEKLSNGDKRLKTNALIGIKVLVREFNLGLSENGYRCAKLSLNSDEAKERQAALNLLGLLYENNMFSKEKDAEEKIKTLLSDPDADVRKIAVKVLGLFGETIISADFDELAVVLLKKEDERSKEGWFSQSDKEVTLESISMILDNPNASISVSAVDKIRQYAVGKEYDLGIRKMYIMLEIAEKLIKRKGPRLTIDDLFTLLNKAYLHEGRDMEQVLRIFKALIEDAPEDYEIIFKKLGLEVMPGKLEYLDTERRGLLGIAGILGHKFGFMKNVVEYCVQNDVTQNSLKAIVYLLQIINIMELEDAINELFSGNAAIAEQFVYFAEKVNDLGIGEQPHALSNILYFASKRKKSVTEIVDILSKVNEDLKKYGFSQWVFYKEILEEIDRDRIVEQWDCIVKMLELGIFPTQMLLYRLYLTSDPYKEIDSFDQTLKGIKDGSMDFSAHNPLLVELGYTLYRKLLDVSPKKSPDHLYLSYKTMVLNKRELGVFSDSGKLNLSDEQDAELKYAAYESYQLVKYVDAIQKKASRPVLIVSNLSYGGFIIDPIRSRLESMGARVASAKIGSTECHDNPFYVKQDLFNNQDLQWIIENKPIIIIVDGTVNIDSKKLDSTTRNTYGGRYPDSYQGYRNYIIALTDAITGGMAHLVADQLGVDELFIDEIRKDAEYSRLLAIMRSFSNSEDMDGYAFRFWNPAGIPLGIREYRSIVNTIDSCSSDSITGPCMVIANSVLSDEYIPDELRTICEGMHHSPAYYDDKDHIQEFKYRVGKRGIQRDMRISEFIRRTYAELEEKFSEWKVKEYQKKEDVDKDFVPDLLAKKKLEDALAKTYRAVVFDFDNTIANQGAADGIILRKIVALLKRGVHVGVVSGKGDGLKRLLIDRLNNMLGSSRDALRFLHIYMHNGGSGYNAFTEEKYYESEFAYVDLYEMEKLLIEKFEYADQIAYFNKGKGILYTTLVPNARVDQTTIVLALNEFFKREHCPFVAATSKLTIDIMPANSDKGRAIRDLSERYGIPIDEIVKLGDQGQKGGNDNSLLIGEGAFSVDEYDAETKQVPVKGAIGLKTVSATRWLFDNIKFKGTNENNDRSLRSVSLEQKTGALEGMVKKITEFTREWSRAGKYAQGTLHRTQFVVPISVLKNAADFTLVLKKMGNLAKGDAIFEIIIYDLEEAIDGDKFIKELNLPDNIRVYSVTKEETGDSNDIVQLRNVIQRKYPVKKGEHLLIATNAMNVESAERLKDKIGPGLGENVFVGAVIEPNEQGVISLSKILADLLDGIGKTKFQVILPVILSSKEIKQRLEEELSALWQFLQSA